MTDHAAPYVPLNVGYVAKTITYIALAGILSLIAALADEVITNVEYVGIAIAFLGAIPVYWTTAARWLKTGVAFALAGLQALVLIVAATTGFDQISLANWLIVLVAALAGIGVAIVPNGAKETAFAVASTGEITLADLSELDTASLQTLLRRQRQAGGL